MSNFQKYFEMAVNFKEIDKRRNNITSIIRSFFNKLKNKNIEYQLLRKNEMGKYTFPVKPAPTRSKKVVEPEQPLQANELFGDFDEKGMYGQRFSKFDVAFIVFDVNEVDDVKSLIQNLGDTYEDFDFDVKVEKRDAGTMFHLKVKKVKKVKEAIEPEEDVEEIEEV